MTLFRDVSIKRKVMLIMMLTSSLALLLAAAGFIVYELATFRQTTVRRLTSDADLIGTQTAAALKFDTADEAYATLESALETRPHLQAAVLYAGTGTNDVRLFTNAPANAFEKGLVPSTVSNDPPEFTKDHVSLFRPIIHRGTFAGYIYLVSDLEEVHALLWRYFGVAAIVLLASLLLSFFLSAELQRVISEPVLRLAETAQIVSDEKNYSLRAVKHGNDELGSLIDDFNVMLGQIQQRDTELQQARDQLEVRVHERTQEIEQQLTRISLLNQISYAVAARQDLDSILFIVLQQLEEHLPVDYGTAYLYDAQSETMTALMRGPKSRPLAAELGLPRTIPVAQTTFEPCLQGEMVYIADGRDLNTPMANKLNSAGLCCVIGSPLMVNNKVTGLLVLGRSKPDAFSAAEREFIRGLSAHVALAVHQAQLYLDLQKAYNDLRQTQQAVMQQQRLQALGQMASGIAHDINNSLSPVIAYSELLEKMEPDLSAQAKKILGNIRTAGEDIAHIVARMREFYRPRDEMEKFSPVSLNKLAEQVIELTRPRWRDIPQSRGHAVEMRTEFDENLPPIMGNPSELREALTNLILNAVDAMPKGGLIIVRTRTAEWDTESDNVTHRPVILEVCDNGIGMNDETRRRCLEPFFSTKGRRGTGLGLAMVYGVAERHEGTIEIESKEGQGATIRLIFPASDVADDMQQQGEKETMPPPLKILCVDDEPLLREVMKEILEADGHKVVLADGGQTGLDAFSTAFTGGEPFDVVLTDLGMPRVNGRQVAQAVKRQSPRTPVIMLTGWGALMKVQGDTPAQVDGVLSKPPRITEIRNTLLECLNKSKRP